MTANLKPLNGTFFINVPLALELRDGVVIAAAVSNPDHADIRQGNSEADWSADIAAELDELWDPVRQPQNYFDRVEAYYRAAIAAARAALPKIGLK